MYSWSKSCQAVCINSLMIWLSVISGLIRRRCLTSIASSCEASGEILMLRGKRPEPLRFPPQFGFLSIIGIFNPGFYLFEAIAFVRYLIDFFSSNHAAMIKEPIANTLKILVLFAHMRKLWCLKTHCVLLKTCHFFNSLSQFIRTVLDCRYFSSINYPILKVKCFQVTFAKLVKTR